jgi:hypothetical protein
VDSSFNDRPLERNSSSTAPGDSGKNAASQQVDAGNMETHSSENSIMYQQLSPFSSWSDFVSEEQSKLQRLEQHPIWLSFRDPILEQSYVRWSAGHYRKVEDCFLLLALCMLLSLLFREPYRLAHESLWWPLAAVIFLPRLIDLVYPQWYLEHREMVVGLMRLVYTTFVLLVMLPLFRRSVEPVKLTSALWWIRVSGAEHLAIMPLTFLVRYRRYLAHQAYCLAMAMWWLVGDACAVCQPYVFPSICHAKTLVLLCVIGICLPTFVVYELELRSRAQFVRHKLGMKTTTQQRGE